MTETEGVSGRSAVVTGGNKGIGAAIVAFGYVGNPAGSKVSSPNVRMFAALLVGVVLGQAASRITQYFTSSQFKPVRDIADSGKTGPATVVLSGISAGLESAVWAAWGESRTWSIGPARCLQELWPAAARRSPVRSPGRRC